ncbi:hypothetical protein CDAR_94031 [Caerostris darwini]|uniref:Uncharacterized protein n=1 Tax=Caerostris darwini TaxID=1538125 RepID=A0AAV4NMV1_9ARAC|nr:hypothetical protein CDAR_94031 [Caerostris darwini]
MNFMNSVAFKIVYGVSFVKTAMLGHVSPMSLPRPVRQLPIYVKEESRFTRILLLASTHAVLWMRIQNPLDKCWDLGDLVQKIVLNSVQ